MFIRFVKCMFVFGVFGERIEFVSKSVCR